MKKFYFLVAAVCILFCFVGCNKSIHFETVAELETSFYLNQPQVPFFSLYQDYGYAKEKILFEPQGVKYEFEALDESIQKNTVSNALKFTKEGSFLLQGTIKVLNLPYKVPFKKEVLITKEVLKDCPIAGPALVYSDDVDGKTITYKLPLTFGEVSWVSNDTSVAEITSNGGVAIFKKIGTVEFTATLSHETYACTKTLSVEVKKSLPRFDFLRITKTDNAGLSVEEYVATFDGANYEFVVAPADFALTNLILSHAEGGASLLEISSPITPASGGSCSFKKSIFGTEENFVYPIVFKKAK